MVVRGGGWGSKEWGLLVESHKGAFLKGDGKVLYLDFCQSFLNYMCKMGCTLFLKINFNKVHLTDKTRQEKTLVPYLPHMSLEE